MSTQCNVSSFKSSLRTYSYQYIVLTSVYPTHFEYTFIVHTVLLLSMLLPNVLLCAYNAARLSLRLICWTKANVKLKRVVHSQNDGFFYLSSMGG